jgi:hypothetical protein
MNSTEVTGSEVNRDESWLFALAAWPRLQLV